MKTTYQINGYQVLHHDGSRDTVKLAQLVILEDTRTLRRFPPAARVRATCLAESREGREVQATPLPRQGRTGIHRKNDINHKQEEKWKWKEED